MKKVISILLCAILLLSLVSCGAEKHEDIGEYQWADFAKYNSLASENGLGGNKIYIHGKFTEYYESADENPLANYYFSSDGNTWLIGCTFASGFDREKFEEDFLETEITVCGEYLGLSQLLNVPGIRCEKIISAGKTCSIADYYHEVEERNSIETLLSTEIVFDSENRIVFSVNDDLESQARRGVIGCFFDGNDAVVDYSRMLAAVMVMQNFTQEITVAVQSGEDYGAYHFSEEGITAISALDKFSNIADLDNDMALDTYKLIMDQVGKTLESSETEAPEVMQEVQNEEKTIYESAEFIIRYDGWEKGTKLHKDTIEFNFVVENKTENTYTIQLHESSINGYMTDVLLSQEIAPGKLAKCTAFVYCENVEGESVNNFETAFHIFSWKSMHDYFDTPILTIID